MYALQRQKYNIPHYILLGKIISILIILISLFLIILFALPERTASAEQAVARTYCITTVEIQKGDSLWSLAKEYYTDEFSCLSEYIDEIKRMNGLSSNTIYAGNYLLIPQYCSTN